MSSHLKTRRKELNLTLKEVAERVGVSTATVSRWETGNIANMRKDKITALSNVLKVDSDFILGNFQENKELTSYSTKTFEEFLSDLNYESDLNMSLILNKDVDEKTGAEEIELVEIPKKAYKKFLDLFKTFK